MERAWNERHRWRDVGIAAAARIRTLIPREPERSSDDAIAYTAVRSELERAGTPIGPALPLIAAVARKLVQPFSASASL